MPAELLSCPGCAAPRVDGPECPRCGILYAKAIPATPGPWVTSSWNERSVFFGIVLFAGWAWLARWAWRGDRRWLPAVGTGLVLQVVGTFGLSLATARTFVTFGYAYGLWQAQRE